MTEKGPLFARSSAAAGDADEWNSLFALLWQFNLNAKLGRAIALL